MVQQCSSFPAVAEQGAGAVVASNNQQEHRSCSEVYVGTDDQTKRSTELLGEKYQRRAYSYSNNRRSQFAAAQQTPQQSSTTSLILKSFLNATAADNRDNTSGGAETWFASRDLALSRSSFDNHSAVPAIASSDSLGLFNFTPSCSREDDECKVDDEEMVVERQDEEEEAEVYNQDHEYYYASQSKALFHQQQQTHPSVVQVTSPHPPKTTSTVVKGILKSPTCVRTNISSTEKSVTTTATAAANTSTATFLNLGDFFCWK